MKERFHPRDINGAWVCGGGIICLAAVLDLTLREAMWGGPLPSILLAVGVLVLGTPGAGERSLVGGIWWGRLIFVATAVWLLAHNFVQSLAFSISGSPSTSTAVVLLLDVGFAALLIEATRRGGTLDHRLWIASTAILGFMLLVQILPIVMAVSMAPSEATFITLQISSVTLTVGAVALGGVFVFAGAAQHFDKSSPELRTSESDSRSDLDFTPS